MSLEKKVHIERVLIVLTPNGEFLAAHQEKLERIVEDGKTIAAKQLPAEPLEEAALAKVLPAHAQVLAAFTVLQKEHAAVVRARDQVIATCEQLEGEIGRLKSEIEELQAAKADG